ncbi:MAG: manganese efflux pump [Deltaproteobacteria bacterium]|nr:manganese efflux pump [Kofleriaceae bacterium]
MLAAVVLALGLSMDAVAAIAVRGLAATHVRPRDALLSALFVGGAHAITVTAGWQLGEVLGRSFEAYDHWIAFVLLVGLGIRAIVDAARSHGDGYGGTLAAERAFAPRVLAVLAVATSIDGLAAGVTTPLLATPPGVTIAIITATAAVLTFAAAYAGRAIGARVGGRLGFLGGLALCGIGVKILVEHL